ncbi:MAG: hypothetical protein EOM32_07825 [Spirochaetia bacterium]|nr:hypothetical protein [Spirochaetia bacterium]NCC88988.1 hypothetical protein [Spirochaetia bacterium]
MRLRFVRRLVLFSFSLLLMLPAYSLPLQTVLEQAFAKSVRMQDLELQKQDALLTLSKSEAEDALGITLTSGNVSATYDESTNAYTFATSGTEALFALPNDGNTTISVGADTLKWTPSTSAYTIAPSASVSHTITYGYTDDNRTTLSNKSSELFARSTYASSRLSFSNSLYTLMQNILTNEKNLRLTEKSLADQKLSLQQNLQLQLIKEDSLTYLDLQSKISSLEIQRDGLEATRDLLLRQFESTAGFAWEGVEDIPLPSLSFKQDPAGNSSVQLKAIALQLAKEELALKQAEQTNRKLVVGGSLSANNSTSSLDTISGLASAKLSSKAFDVSASFGTSYYPGPESFSSTLTVGGTWRNNPASASDSLTLQQLENTVLMKELEYNTALDTYLYDAAELSAKIASYSMDHRLLEQTMVYNKRLLAQTQILYEKGLATKAALEDAQFTVAQDAYELSVQLLKGLSLETEIQTMYI